MIHVMQTECGMNCGTTLSPFIKDDSLYPLDRRSYEGSTEASFLKIDFDQLLLFQGQVNYLTAPLADIRCAASAPQTPDPPLWSRTLILPSQLTRR